jgi:hypothetical protein
LPNIFLGGEWRIAVRHECQVAKRLIFAFHFFFKFSSYLGVLGSLAVLALRIISSSRLSSRPSRLCGFPRRGMYKWEREVAALLLSSTGVPIECHEVP